MMDDAKRAARAAANKWLAQEHAAGYETRFVEPPKHPGGCRSCGINAEAEDRMFAVCLITQRDEEAGISYFSFATLCNDCRKDEERQAAMVDEMTRWRHQ